MIEFFCVLFGLIMLMISLAFSTLLERNILGFGNYRFGVNFVRFYGGLQPFRDAFKLFFKGFVFLFFVDFFF